MFTGAELMDYFRKEFFSGTAFAGDQDSNICCSHLPGNIDSPVKEWRIPYDTKPLLYHLNVHRPIVLIDYPTF
jgi:hypothetical protein